MSSGTLFEGFFGAVMLKWRRIYRRPWASVVQAEPKKYLGLFTLPGIQGFHNAGKQPTLAQRHPRSQCYPSL